MQASLAKHERIFAFPETQLPYNFFSTHELRQFGPVESAKKNGIFRLFLNIAYYAFNGLGLCRNNHKYLLEECQSRNFGEILISPRQRSFLLRQVFSDYRKVIGEASASPIWIEKTPRNVFVWQAIERYLPDAKFVHIVRKGEDNIASLVDAGNKYDAFSDRFGGAGGVERAVAYWNRAVRQTSRAKGGDNHCIVSYSDLTNEPSAVLQRICDFLDIEFTLEMLDAELERVARGTETWKFIHGGAITPKPSRFTDVFSPDEQAFVSAHVEFTEDDLQMLSI